MSKYGYFILNFCSYNLNFIKSDFEIPKIFQSFFKDKCLKAEKMMNSDGKFDFLFLYPPQRGWRNQKIKETKKQSIKNSQFICFFYNLYMFNIKTGNFSFLIKFGLSACWFYHLQSLNLEMGFCFQVRHKQPEDVPFKKPMT